MGTRPGFGVGGRRSYIPIGGHGDNITPSAFIANQSL